MRAIKYISIAVIILAVFYGFEQAKKAEFYGFHGQTMGTFYNIKIRSEQKINPENLRQKIEQELNKINQQMSVFLPDSEINEINRHPQGTPINLSPEMSNVLQSAQKIYAETQGAFDPTIEPLIELWGFGKERNKKVPTAKEIEQAKSCTGFDKLQINSNTNTLIKAKDNITLNLSAIAKGQGVDRIAELLLKNNINNFIVEIGGEIKTSGTKTADGQDWNIALAAPQKEIILNLNGEAVATSGNYRNFYEIDGKTYGHTISPRTGYPTENNLMSATVIHANCMEADAYATALMVMGREEGKIFAQKQNMAIILQRKQKDKIDYYISPAAKKYIKGQ